MRKRHKFADGGITDGAQQPTYPFYGNQPQAGGASGGVNQTFNMQPQATAGMPEQPYKKGGQIKVGKVMSEFKAGKLKSSSGQKVTNPKQAIAIGLSEAGLSKKAKGGAMKESKTMMKKEVSFMKKKGAPKSMIKHEMAEAGMKKGGGVKRMMIGGATTPGPKPSALSAYGSSTKSSPPPTVNALKAYGSSTKSSPPPQEQLRNMLNKLRSLPTTSPTNRMSMAGGMGSSLTGFGLGKKKGGTVKKMASGGLAAGHKSADGVATKGKTKAKQVAMKHGGMTKKAYGGKC